jgi:hypothetical protein
MPLVAARRHVEQQKVIDRPRKEHQSMLSARMRAVVDAHQATMQQEEGAAYAFRQSLIDLASVAELVAEELPAPRVRWGSRVRI